LVNTAPEHLTTLATAPAAAAAAAPAPAQPVSEGATTPAAAKASAQTKPASGSGLAGGSRGSSSRKMKGKGGAVAHLVLGEDSGHKGAGFAESHPSGSIDPAELFPCAWAPGKAAKLTTQWLEANVQSSLSSNSAAPSGKIHEEWLP